MLGFYLSLIDEPQEQEAFTKLYMKYRKLTDVLELPKKQRDTLYLHALYGYSYKEVANLLGISEVAVRKNEEGTHAG